MSGNKKPAALVARRAAVSLAPESDFFEMPANITPA
jgi:hypothetical protein